MSTLALLIAKGELKRKISIYHPQTFIHWSVGGAATVTLQFVFENQCVSCKFLQNLSLRIESKCVATTADIVKVQLQMI